MQKKDVTWLSLIFQMPLSLQEFKKKDIVIIRLRGKLAELMVATAPEIYKKYVSVNCKGELVLYAEALNALYGITKAALIFI